MRLRSISRHFPLWRYYFWDMPLWVLGLRSARRLRRIRQALAPEIAATRSSLQRFYAEQPPPKPIETMVDLAVLIRVLRNGDAFACLPVRPDNLHRYFNISGWAHLQAAIATQRPVMLLTGHIGSFYTIAPALAQRGIAVNALARTVDTSEHNPWPQQLFERANYHLTERKMSGRYLYTDRHNKVDRGLVRLCKAGGVLLILPDLPRHLMPSARQPVQLLGKPSSLPARTIALGLKYHAVFLSVWNTIEPAEDDTYRRHLRIEPIIAGTHASDILQQYADRLSHQVRQQPWQWMGTMILDHYSEANEP